MNLWYPNGVLCFTGSVDDPQPYKFGNPEFEAGPVHGSRP